MTIKTPAQWAALFDGTHSKAATVALCEEVRAVLASMPDSAFTTADLVERLWSGSCVSTDAQSHARKRLVDGLLALANGALRDCARKSPVGVKRYGRMMFPWEWSAAPERVGNVTCPNCNHNFEVNIKEG